MFSLLSFRTNFKIDLSISSKTSAKILMENALNRQINLERTGILAALIAPFI